jgi:hypothetical protein
VREFDTKWLRGGAPADETLMGSGDIQSLADLGNSFEVLRSMRVIPVTRDAVLQLTVATLAPIAPLLLTIMPLEELLFFIVIPLCGLLTYNAVTSGIGWLGRLRSRRDRSRR